MALSKILRTVAHPRKTPPRKVGAGDAVAVIAQPIANVIDAAFGTDVANCKPCTGPGGRKDRLNAAIPDLAAVPGQLIELGKEVLKGLVK